MFRDTASFQGAGLGSWDVSRVEQLSFAFRNTTSFNADLSSWDVSSVTSGWGAFEEAVAFNVDLSRWQLTSVTDIDAMFGRATSFSQNLCAWGDHIPSSTTNTFGTFQGTSCPNMDNPNLSASPPGPFCFDCTDDSGPVAAPVETPVASPVAPPVDSPIASPVAPPVDSPVASPAAPPTADSEPPVDSPVQPPVGAPVSPPASAPVAAPNGAPVEQPAAPTASAQFADLTELQEAVDSYLEDSSPESEVVLTYGPIETWDVSQVSEPMKLLRVIIDFFLKISNYLGRSYTTQGTRLLLVIQRRPEPRSGEL